MTTEEKETFKVRTTPLMPSVLGMEATFWGMDAKDIGEKVGLKHSSQLVMFVLQAQTYPSGDVRSLALEIANHYNPGFGYAFPTHARLSELLGVSTDTIGRWVKQLEATGYWEIRPPAQGRAMSYSPSALQFAIFSDWQTANSEGKRFADDIRKVAPAFKRGKNSSSFASKPAPSPTAPLLLDETKSHARLQAHQVVLVNSLMAEFHGAKAFPPEKAQIVQNSIVNDLEKSEATQEAFAAEIRAKVAKTFPKA